MFISSRQRWQTSDDINRADCRTYTAQDDFLLFGVLQGIGVRWNLVASGFDFVPGRSVIFLLMEKKVHLFYKTKPYKQPCHIVLCKIKIKI